MINTIKHNKLQDKDIDDGHQTNVSSLCILWTVVVNLT